MSDTQILNVSRSKKRRDQRRQAKLAKNAEKVEVECKKTLKPPRNHLYEEYRMSGVGYDEWRRMRTALVPFNPSKSDTIVDSMRRDISFKVTIPTDDTREDPRIFDLSLNCNVWTNSGDGMKKAVRIFEDRNPSEEELKEANKLLLAYLKNEEVLWKIYIIAAHKGYENWEDVLHFLETEELGCVWDFGVLTGIPVRYELK